MIPNYLSRLYSENELVDNGYAVSGPDGLAQMTEEEQALLDQAHLAETNPDFDEETVVHSDYGYPYYPQTYFYADEGEDEEPTDEELEEETIKQALYDAWLGEQTRQYNAYATAQALEDLGLRMYADGEEGDEDESEDDEDEVETLKQALLEDYLYSRYYAEGEDDEEDEDDDEPQSEAEVIKQSLYDDYMTRIYAELGEDEDIVHVDETGNEVHPEVVKQALFDDYIYTNYYADVEDDADAVQDLHEGEDTDEHVDVPTNSEELSEEATKKQSSVFAIEESVDALLNI